MYTLEEQAIHFVEKAFAGQKRIKEDIEATEKIDKDCCKERQQSFHLI